MEELRLALIGDGARQQRLAGPGRAVQQHALGRVDAQALEQLGMAQRQLDHLAQLVDRVLHPAEVVVGDVGAALAFLLLGEFGQQLDLGLLVDVDDAARGGRNDRQPDFLQREGRRVEQLPDMLGHVGIDPLMPGGGDGVALAEWPALEAALQRIGRALQADIVLGRREHNAGRGLAGRLVDLDEVARADAGVGALQAVEADDVEPIVLPIGADGAGSGRALADDLDDVAFLEAKFFHQLDGQAGDAASAVGRGQVGDLHAPDQCIDSRHPFALQLLTENWPKTGSHQSSTLTVPRRIKERRRGIEVQSGGGTSQKKGRALPPGRKFRRGCLERHALYRTAQFTSQVRNRSCEMNSYSTCVAQGVANPELMC